MALEPLPTTSIAESSVQAQTPFPYADLSEGIATLQTRPPIQPLLSQTSDVSSEQSRMVELENMLSEAQSRAAMIEQEAYDKAYAAGEKSGLALGEKRAEQILEMMQAVVHSAEQELQALQQQSVDAVMDIAQGVLEHVMGTTGQDMTEALQTAVNQALAQFLPHDERHVVLAVHPQDLTMFQKMTDLKAYIRFQSDASILAGTCRLMTANQDTIIDPKQSIKDAITYAREQLKPNV